MSNWIFNAFKKEAKKEDKGKTSTNEKASKFFLNSVKDSYETQVSIISDMSLVEKVVELSLQKKSQATDPIAWSSLYEKVYSQVEKNRSKVEKTLLKMLSGDYTLLAELIDGKANAKEEKPKKGDPISKKDEEVNTKDYDTGRKIQSTKHTVGFNKRALKESPWTIKKDEESGKETIVALHEKDKFLSDESKGKIKKGKK